MSRIGAATLILVSTLIACSGFSTGSWSDSSGAEVPTDTIWSYVGERQHCGWQSATFLVIGGELPPEGIPETHHGMYVRDPANLFGDLLTDSFDDDVTLPGDAVYSGYSTRKVRLWYSPTIHTAVFLEMDDRIERWPKATQIFGCA